MLEHVYPELANVICMVCQKRSLELVSKAPAIRAEMDRLNILFQKGRITDEYYDNQYSTLENALENALKDEDQNTSEERYRHYSKLQKHFTGNWKELYEMLDASHKNAFWKRVIKKIYFDKDTHKISGFSFV